VGNLEIAEFGRRHVSRAAALFCAQFARLRRAVPDLPDHYADPEGVIPLISKLYDRAPGVAALEDGTLVGYLIGVNVPAFKSPHAGIYCPEWAHGASRRNRGQVYREMYGAIAEGWVHDGGIMHCMTHLANDTEAIQAFGMLGFGTMTVDAILGTLAKSPRAPVGIEIAPIRPDGVEGIMPLSLGLEDHLRMSPSFMHVLEHRESDYYRAFLSGKGKSIWVASYRNRPISYIKCEPSIGGNACQVVRDPGVIAITGAYTEPSFRNRGVATAILQRLLEQARREGYSGCSVDFESANPVASDFWLRYFRPVCFSMMRYIDERIGATGDVVSQASGADAEAQRNCC